MKTGLTWTELADGLLFSIVQATSGQVQSVVQANPITPAEPLWSVPQDASIRKTLLDLAVHGDVTDVDLWIAVGDTHNVTAEYHVTFSRTVWARAWRRVRRVVLGNDWRTVVILDFPDPGVIARRDDTATVNVSAAVPKPTADGYVPRGRVVVLHAVWYVPLGPKRSEEGTE